MESNMSDKSVYDHFLKVRNILNLKALEDTPKDELTAILNDAADAVDADATNFGCYALGDYLREASDLIEMNEPHNALELLKDLELEFDAYTGCITYLETN